MQGSRDSTMKQVSNSVQAAASGKDPDSHQSIAVRWFLTKEVQGKNSSGGDLNPASWGVVTAWLAHKKGEQAYQQPRGLQDSPPHHTPPPEGQGFLLCSGWEMSFRPRAPELEGAWSLYTFWGHPDFRVPSPCPLQLIPQSNFWPILKDGPLRSSLVPTPCQLPHKTFPLEELPAMPSTHLPVQPDGGGQGTQAPILRVMVS